MRLIGLTALTVLAAGCSKEDAAAPDAAADAHARKDAGDVSANDCSHFVGDAAAPVALVLTAIGADTLEHPLKDGDKLPLLLPPQGGRVAFVGVRALNLDGCAVTLSGVLRDEQSGQERAEERPVNLVRGSDGWAATGVETSDGLTVGTITNFSNITLCPNQWSTTDLYGHEYVLTVTVTDATKRTGKSTIHVSPWCAEPEPRLAQCLCICRQGYALGQSCENDSGVADAGVTDAPLE